MGEGEQLEMCKERVWGMSIFRRMGTHEQFVMACTCGSGLVTTAINARIYTRATLSSMFFPAA